MANFLTITFSTEPNLPHEITEAIEEFVKAVEALGYSAECLDIKVSLLGSD